jgi:ATP-dependent helicase/nuclease subunit A
MSAAPLKREVDPRTRALQAKAADPMLSAWVTANAGSGKTHVLTQRVIRLLLDGVDPARILCLTFTKAAAANMSTRVFRTLAHWTTLSDEALSKEILATGVPKLEPGALAFARKLFARTIETPGGLKIQTIHAFCERLLHLFPFEANAPAGFQVLDDRAADDLIAAARASAIAEAGERPELAEAIETLARLAGADGFDALLSEALTTRSEILGYGGAEAYGERLRARLGLDHGDTVAALDREMLAGGGGPAQWRAWARKLRDGLKNDQERAGEFAAAAVAPDDMLKLDLLRQAFFNQDGTPTKQLTTKGLRERYPELDEELGAEQARLGELSERRRSAVALTRSTALVRVAEAVLAAYARLKNARGALDFADLVERALALVEKADAAWVLYKLDKGIAHFLVDEAQDTSRAQWAILERLAEEFLSGEGGGETKRTFFAVGDEKQSIFSFQGAEPALFDEMRRSFERRHASVRRPFARVPLHLSFRSAPKVLAAVDAVFGLEAAWRGVSAGGEPPPTHGAHHASLPGVVEIWETIKPQESDHPEDWRLPLDAQTGSDPPVRLAERIGDLILGWLAPNSPERLSDPATGELRRVRANDILILVRSRGAFYEAMTRALRRRRLDFAGADRIRLSEHMAVIDLVSAGRAALYRDDDLVLAEVLKSPLIGLDDEVLMELAPRRPGALADALAASKYTQAAAQLDIWRRRARTLAPFDFYVRLLGADGGRRALISRLGAEAAEAIDEFLATAMAFESATSPSLSAFLDEISASETEIKREAEAEGSGVRVMTVHAAKGLEAQIVFLPDTTGKASGSHPPRWLAFETEREGERGLRVWATKQDEDSAPLKAARVAVGAIAEGEHRRLLYVAMTRAAQRLIICGVEGRYQPPADCWYALIRAGLEPALTPAPAPWPGQETVRRFADAPGAAPEQIPRPPKAERPAPTWLHSAPPVDRAVEPFAPSSLADPRQGRADFERRRAREVGRLAHALIEKLPEVTPPAREAAAARYLAAHGADLPEAQRAEIAARVLRILSDPELVYLFGPNSRAEVAITGAIAHAGGKSIPVSGRIDRLVVGPGHVEIVDFKSGLSGREAFVAQLALYVAALRPLYQRPIRASLVWLDVARREPISDVEINVALGQLMLTIVTAP